MIEFFGNMAKSVQIFFYALCINTLITCTICKSFSTLRFAKYIVHVSTKREFPCKHSSTSTVSVQPSAIFKVSFEIKNSGKSSVSAVNVNRSTPTHSNAKNLIVMFTS